MGRGGQNSMAKGSKEGKQTMARGVDIPWVAGQNIMDRGPQFHG